MKKIFPKEIIALTTESHFAKFNSNVKIIYLLVLLLLLSIVAILPVIKVNITQQGRGTIRSLEENNNVIAAIYGQIAENRLQENLNVNKGDTLLILNVEKVDQDIASIRHESAVSERFKIPFKWKIEDFKNFSLSK